MSEALKQQLDDIDTRLQHDTFYPAVQDQLRQLHKDCKAQKYAEGILRVEQHLVNIEDQAGNFETAEKLNTKVKRQAKKSGLYRVYHECAYYEIVRSLRGGDPKASYPMAQELLAEANKQGDTYTIANTQLLLGIITQQFGFDNEAIERFRKSLSLSQEHKYHKATANALIHLSELFLTKLQFVQAEQYANECLRVNEHIGDSIQILRSKIRIATILIEKNELPNTKLLLNEIQNNSHLLTGPLLGTYHVCNANYFARMKQLQNAIDEFSKAIEIFRLYNRQRLICNIYGIMGSIFINDKNSQQTIETAGKMQVIAVEMKDGYHITSSYHLLYQGYKMAGDLVAAFEYLEHYNERLKAEEEQLLELRLEFIELQKDYDMKEKEASKERERAALLKIELEHKERELTEKTRHLIKQTDALAQFRDDLRAIIRRSPSDDPLVQEIKERVRNLPESQLNWEQFDEQFNLVHPAFHSKLLEKHPKLTKMERKVCTLLRLNMTSIDIAKLLYLSERNIENHRYRIRKKISLNTENSLQEYLSKL